MYRCVFEYALEITGGRKFSGPSQFSKVAGNPSRTRYFYAHFNEIHVLRFILKKIELKPLGYC